MKLGYSATCIVAVLCSALTLTPLTGCTVSQAKINQAMTDIQNWTPVIASDTSALLTDIASFEPQDAAAINQFVATLNADSASLSTLCKQYLTAPSASVLAQISSTVTLLATADSSALLGVLQIKNATSRQIAQGILTTIATALTILSGYLQAAGAPPVSVSALKPYVDRAALGIELAKAKDQGLVPKDATLQMAGL
jgi:hypothetical protein